MLRPAQALHDDINEQQRLDASRRGTCPASATTTHCAAGDGVEYSFEGKRVKIKIQGGVRGEFLGAT